MRPPKQPRIIVLLLALVFGHQAGLASQRGPYSAGGGTLPDPPTSTPHPSSYQPGVGTPPTGKVVGPLPSFIYSTVSDRFLLVLRRTDGSIVDVARARSRHEAVLSGPEGESLRLDVIPLDGAGVPILGIPVEIGVSVAVAIGAR
ncbi:MAG: hypothetical protein H6825_03380 [Planctomycetes bacterium]|nr:hypothetical protein [Planctomycetota bacterium]